MESFGFVFSLCLLMAIASVSEGVVVCKNNTDCGVGECCYIKPEFEVVSRRRQAGLLPVIPGHHDTGICERYHLEHEHCGWFEKPNGHCGCASGLQCVFVPAATTALPLEVSEKRDIFMHGPGTFECEKQS